MNKANFITHRDPVLPQKKNGMLAFERSEDVGTIFQGEMDNYNSRNMQFISNREQIKLIQNLRAKKKNFDD